jgi:PAS domain S-box-containing protein
MIPEMNQKASRPQHKISPKSIKAVESNLTDHKLSEKEIYSMAKFPSENPNPVLRLSQEGIVLYVNKAGRQIIRKWNTVVGSTVPEEIKLIVKDAFSRELTRTVEIECDEKIFSFHFVPIINERYINLYGQDVTERSKVEEKLRQSEEKYRLIFEIANEGIWITDSDRKTILVNQRMADMLGYSIEEIIAKTPSEFLCENQEQISLKTRQKLKSGIRTTQEFKFQRKEGSILWVISNASPAYDTEGRYITVSMLTDITERKKIENALREAQEKLNIALENGKIGIWEWDIKTDEVIWDERMEKMFGLKPGTFGKTYEEFEKLVHEEDVTHIRKTIEESLVMGIPFETIFRIRPDKENPKYLSAKGLVNKDREGNPAKLYGVCFDVTGLKEGTEHLSLKLNEELLRSNKELERFAYVASHDLQEPLRMVSSFTQLLEKQYGDKLDKNAQDYIKFAVDGAKRMHDLINGLLEYSRVHTRGKEFSRVKMKNVVQRVMMYFENQLKEKNLKLTFGDLPDLIADEEQMIQLIQNLLSNSIKFSENNKKIHIGSEIKKDMYIFKVKDEGIGIEEQYFGKIFEIFRRLMPKDEYEGTGIGLAICKRIVERHSGEIWLESKLGEGSTFIFSLPKNKELN